YLLVYTPLKRRTPLCTLVGAIPGALPPMIGWAGARHALGVEAWVLFALLFIWQLPHFLALAVLYREDYARAGFPMLPLVEPDGLMTARQTALYGLALLPVSLFPTMIGVAGPAYFYGAIVLSLVFFVMAARTAWRRSRQSARQLFLASVLYLPVLLSLLALDRSPR
ncbi:MAG: protoheme IX farnesyltransferase, partial [Candidatus Omnitrophica bacterium]|nr:protoheme IX farnesyltransferase [Candidatus Omnitrophota bacterium]